MEKNKRQNSVMFCYSSLFLLVFFFFFCTFSSASLYSFMFFLYVLGATTNSPYTSKCLNFLIFILFCHLKGRGSMNQECIKFFNYKNRQIKKMAKSLVQVKKSNKKQFRNTKPLKLGEFTLNLQLSRFCKTSSSF